MELLIIAVSALLLAVIVAYIAKRKEYNDLLDKYSDEGKLICKLKNELNQITAENVRLVGENREYFVEKMRQNFYHEFHKFVLVSDELSNYMEQMPKRYEEDGYIYDKDKSFPTVLCFTKRVPTIKDEPKDETDPTEETFIQTPWDHDPDEERHEQEEKIRIEMELMECEGDEIRAAKHLGMTKAEFNAKLFKYGIYKK